MRAFSCLYVLNSSVFNRLLPWNEYLYGHEIMRYLANVGIVIKNQKLFTVYPIDSAAFLIYLPMQLKVNESK